MPTVTTSSELRDAIQSASSSNGTEIITLDSTNAFSVDTLAKLICFNPAPYPESGYTIQGNDQTIANTRIYQENIDGPYSAWNIVGAINALDPLPLTFSYTSGGAADGTALLRATSGSYYLDSLRFTGNHTGWIGNGNLYMSLTGFDAANPINVDLSLANSLIGIKGQGNFNPAAPNTGGSAFLHSFNNNGNIYLYGNTFDEAEYLSSFNFFNESAPWGNATVQSNLFTRSNNANVRRRGSRITNANVNLIDNTFENGAFIDVFGNIDGITLNSDPVMGSGFSSFNTIAGGYGIRANYDASLGYISGTIPVPGNVHFSGDGLPLKYEQYGSPSPGVFTLDAGTYSGTILVSNSIITNKQFSQASAGGQADDQIDPLGSTTHMWAFGDLGDDTINGANEEDYLDGGEGNDSIYGGAGDDYMLGGDGDDMISGSVGADYAEAGSGNDYVSGMAGNDTFFGGTGNDILMGEINNDSLVGEDGNDTLNGGTAADTLTGGFGNDLFVWTTTSPTSNDGTDTITDFTTTSPTADVDQMGLTDVFPNTSPGNTLNSLDFSTATSVGTINVNDDNKVIRITTAQTNPQISGTTRAGLLNAFVLAFNSSAGLGVLVFDTDWGNTTGRTTVAAYSSINTLPGVSSFTNTNFYAV